MRRGVAGAHGSNWHTTSAHLGQLVGVLELLRLAVDELEDELYELPGWLKNGCMTVR